MNTSRYSKPSNTMEICSFSSNVIFGLEVYDPLEFFRFHSYGFTAPVHACWSTIAWHSRESPRSARFAPLQLRYIRFILRLFRGTIASAQALSASPPFGSFAICERLPRNVAVRIVELKAGKGHKVAGNNTPRWRNINTVTRLSDPLMSANLRELNLSRTAFVARRWKRHSASTKLFPRPAGGPCSRATNASTIVQQICRASSVLAVEISASGKP